MRRKSSHISGIVITGGEVAKSSAILSSSGSGISTRIIPSGVCTWVIKMSSKGRYN